MRQEIRIMEKENIERLERYRYNPKEFLRHCKTLKNGYKSITQFIVNGEGEQLSNSRSKAEEFQKYFDQLLNSEYSVSQEEDDDEEKATNNSLENEEVEPSRVETIKLQEKIEYT